MNEERVFYSAAKRCVIDGIRDDGRGLYSRETLDEVRLRYPDCEAVPIDTAIERMDAAFRSPPVEITAERFWEMLEVLPPVAWKRGADTESFKLSEFTSGAITQIFCRIDERYFELSDNVTLPHDEIVRRCREVVS